MAQKTQKKQRENKKLAKIDPEIIDINDEDTAEEPETELDPEILEAIQAKKPKKIKAQADVDYIPELERDANDFDYGDDSI